MLAMPVIIGRSFGGWGLGGGGVAHGGCLTAELLRVPDFTLETLQVESAPWLARLEEVKGWRVWRVWRSLRQGVPEWHAIKC